MIFTRDTHPENYLETNEDRHLPVVHCVKDTPKSYAAALAVMKMCQVEVTGELEAPAK